jgi:hypothetical protein
MSYNHYTTGNNSTSSVSYQDILNTVETIKKHQDEAERRNPPTAFLYRGTMAELAADLGVSVIGSDVRPSLGDTWLHGLECVEMPRLGATVVGHSRAVRWLTDSESGMAWIALVAHKAKPRELYELIPDTRIKPQPVSMVNDLEKPQSHRFVTTLY